MVTERNQYFLTSNELILMNILELEYNIQVLTIEMTGRKP